MSGWWVLAFTVVALGACVDQLIRTRRYVAAFEQLGAAAQEQVLTPGADVARFRELMRRVDELHQADRRAARVYVVAGVLVLAVGLVLS